jgi:small subunit ribosomal protein S4
MRWRQKLKFCKLYMEDFWGKLLRKARKSYLVGKNPGLKTVRYLRWSTVKHFDKKRNKEFYLNIKKVIRKQRLGGPLRAKYKVKRYYGGMSQVEYCRLLREARARRRRDLLCKRTGRTFTNTFMGLLEKRLETIIFRMNLASTIEEAKVLIKMGNFSVNGKSITKTKYVVSVGDVISVRRKKHEVFRKRLEERLRYNGVIVNYPRYMEVNYAILSGILISEPLLSEIPFLGRMNMEAIAGAIT